MDADAIAKEIEFHLAQLGTRNDHHAFEHLCRHLARARIASNVLPATGPVSAGGDQSRDFETFRTELDPTTSAFAATASREPLAFACSLQRDIVPKIRSDVRKIVHAEPGFAAIHYFCAEPVQIAKRHELQTWARDIHSITLYIHDRAAIAELLAARDTIWIAVRFLGVSQTTADTLQKYGLDDVRDSAARMADYLASLIERPFAGRDDELARLDSIIELGGRVLVTGRAGYGKTQLLAHWVNRLQRRGVAVAYYFFTHLRASTAGGPNDVAEAFAAISHQVEANCMRRAFPAGLAPAARLRELLRGHTGPQPLVVVLDGLDEVGADADPPTVAALPRGVTVVASVRSDQLTFRPRLREWSAGAERITVQRLGREAVAELLRADQSEGVRRLADDPGITAILERVAAGFPLYLGFLIEDLRAAVAEGMPAASLLRDPVAGFGEYVHDRALVLLQSGASAAELRVLATLAVAQGRMPANVLCAVAAIDDSDLARLPPATARWLTFSHGAAGGEYGYQHDLLADGFRAVLTQNVAQARAALGAFCAADGRTPSPSTYVVRHAMDHLIETGRWEDVLALAQSQPFLAQQAAVDGSGVLSVTTMRHGASAAVKLGRPADAAALLVRSGYASEARRLDFALLAARSDDIDDVIRIIGPVASVRSLIVLIACALEMARHDLRASWWRLFDRIDLPARTSWAELNEEEISVLEDLLARLALEDHDSARRLAESVLERKHLERWLELTIELSSEPTIRGITPLLTMPFATDDHRRQFADRAFDLDMVDLALETCAGIGDDNDRVAAWANLVSRLAVEQRAPHVSFIEAMITNDDEKASFAARLMLEDGAFPAELEQQITQHVMTAPDDTRPALMVSALLLAHAAGHARIGEITADAVTTETATLDAGLRRAAYLELARTAAPNRPPDVLRWVHRLLAELRPPDAEGRMEKEDEHVVDAVLEILLGAAHPEALPVAEVVAQQFAVGPSRVRVLAKLALVRERAGDREGAVRLLESIQSVPLDPFEAVWLATAQAGLGMEHEAVATLDAAARTILVHDDSPEENFIDSMFADDRLAAVIGAYSRMGRIDTARALVEHVEGASQRLKAAHSIAEALFDRGNVGEALQAMMLAFRPDGAHERVTEIAGQLTDASGLFHRDGSSDSSLGLLRAAAAILHAAAGDGRLNASLWPIHMLQRLRGGTGDAASGFRSAFEQFERIPRSAERRKIGRTAVESFLELTDGAKGSATLIQHLDGRSRDESVDSLTHLILRDLSRELGPDPHAFQDNMREPVEAVERESNAARRMLYWRELAFVFWRIDDQGDSVKALLSRSATDADDPVDFVALAMAACWTGAYDWLPDRVADDLGEFGSIIRFDTAVDLLERGNEEEALSKTERITERPIRAAALRRIATVARDATVRRQASSSLEVLVTNGGETSAGMWLDLAVAAGMSGHYATGVSALTAASRAMNCAQERALLERFLPFNDEKD